MSPQDKDECCVESAPIAGKPYKQTILADDYFNGLSRRADAEFIVNAVNAFATRSASSTPPQDDLRAELAEVTKEFQEAAQSRDKWREELAAERALLQEEIKRSAHYHERADEAEELLAAERKSRKEVMALLRDVLPVFDGLTDQAWKVYNGYERKRAIETALAAAEKEERT